MQLSMKVFLVTTFIFLASATVMAQRGIGSNSAEETAAKQTEQMVERLNLNDEQQGKVQTINLAYAERIQEVREANAGNRSGLKEIMAAINKEKKYELKALLSNEQFSVFEKMENSSGSRSGKRGRGTRGE